MVRTEDTLFCCVLDIVVIYHVLGNKQCLLCLYRYKIYNNIIIQYNMHIARSVGIIYILLCIMYNIYIYYLKICSVNLQCVLCSIILCKEKLAENKKSWVLFLVT